MIPSIGWNLMDVVRTATGVVAILIGGAFSPSYAQEASAPPHSDAVFRDLIAQRLDAYGRGDSAAYSHLIANEFVHIMDTGIRRTRDDLLAAVAANAGSKARYDVGALHAQVYGQVAVVDCAVIHYPSFGPRAIAMPFHETDVFIWREGRWLYLHHQETLTVVNPKAHAQDVRSLDDYVGRYEWWPGYVDIITRQGHALFGQDSPGAAPTPMEASSGESFFVTGDASHLTFVRDRHGRVTHYLLHFPNGQVVVARKLAVGARPN
jgi:hypothetical protein